MVPNVFGWATISLLAAAALQICVSAQEPCTFVGAVYEHAFNLADSDGNPIEIMETNLEVFNAQCTIAAERGAQVVVFPERGITGLLWDSTQEVYYQHLPDPSSGVWNPCLTVTPTNDTLVPYSLSCAARDNAIMVVANFPTAESCDEFEGYTCPDRGEYHFSTDVVFGPDGTLLARYHKMNLYGEPMFDVPPTPEVVYLDTPFGRLGLLTCFDLLWEVPTVELVQQFQVDTLLFPTAWQDQLPFLTSVQAQSSFAIGLHVNILAANMHFPLAGFMGSGVYAGSLGSVNYAYDAAAKNGTLLIAPLSCWRNGTNNREFETFEGMHQTPQFLPTAADTFHFLKHENLSEFVGVALTQAHPYELNTRQLCQGALCCGVNYTLYDELPANASKPGTYVLVVHRGNISEGDLYTYSAEVCTVLWCQTANNLETCARQPEVPVTTGLVDLALWGEFSTQYVYPSVFTDQLQLLPTYRWTHWLPAFDPDDGSSTWYADIRLRMPGGALPPVKTAAVTLYGRLYGEDVVEVAD